MKEKENSLEETIIHDSHSSGIVIKETQSATPKSAPKPASVGRLPPTTRATPSTARGGSSIHANAQNKRQTTVINQRKGMYFSLPPAFGLRSKVLDNGSK